MVGLLFRDPVVPARSRLLIAVVRHSFQIKEHAVFAPNIATVWTCRHGHRLDVCTVPAVLAADFMTR